MRKWLLVPAVVVSSVVLLAGTASAQAVGTWRLNIAKSKYNAGTPPKSSTLVYEAAGAGITATVDSVGATGTVSHYTFTTNFDGKDNPVVGNLNLDTVSRTRVNATTTTGVSKKGGKVTNTGTFVVASDGKTLTITNKGTDALGKPVDNVSVYDKQ